MSARSSPSKDRSLEQPCTPASRARPLSPVSIPSPQRDSTPTNRKRAAPDSPPEPTHSPKRARASLDTATSTPIPAPQAIIGFTPINLPSISNATNSAAVSTPQATTGLTRTTTNSTTTDPAAEITAARQTELEEQWLRDHPKSTRGSKNFKRGTNPVYREKDNQKRAERRQVDAHFEKTGKVLHPHKYIECAECREGTPSVLLIKDTHSARHFNTKHKDKAGNVVPKPCEVCHLMFRNQDELERHIVDECEGGQEIEEEGEEGEGAEEAEEGEEAEEDEEADEREEAKEGEEAEEGDEVDEGEEERAGSVNPTSDAPGQVGHDEVALQASSSSSSTSVQGIHISTKFPAHLVMNGHRFRLEATGHFRDSSGSFLGFLDLTGLGIGNAEKIRRQRRKSIDSKGSQEL